MKRGDVVLGAIPGDYGKPRPSVVVQSDHLNPEHHSVLIAPCTTHFVEAPIFRITLLRSNTNGLLEDSQIMVDKMLAVKRSRIREVIGAISSDELAMLDRSLALVLGLADRRSS